MHRACFLERCWKSLTTDGKEQVCLFVHVLGWSWTSYVCQQAGACLSEGLASCYIGCFRSRETWPSSQQFIPVLWLQLMKYSYSFRCFSLCMFSPGFSAAELPFFTAKQKWNPPTKRTTITLHCVIHDHDCIACCGTWLFLEDSSNPSESV